MFVFEYTVKPVTCNLKIDKTKVLKTNGSLMNVKISAECSHRSLKFGPHITFIASKPKAHNVYVITMSATKLSTAILAPVSGQSAVNVATATSVFYIKQDSTNDCYLGSLDSRPQSPKHYRKPLKSYLRRNLGPVIVMFKPWTKSRCH